MKAQLRQEKHQLGQEFMNDRDYLSAMNAFLEALEKHGPHVNLLADLTACFYRLGRMEDCLLTAKRLEFELNQALPSLQKKHATRIYLFLAQIYEDSAFVAKALSLYRQAAELCESEAGDLRTQTFTHFLRLKSHLGIKSGLLEIYQTCLQLKTHSLALKTELAHSLILAEMVLFGTQKAMNRALQFLKDNSSFAFDSKLILIDLIEESVREKLKMPELKEALKIARFKNLNLFEQAILDFYKMPTKVLTTEEMNYLGKELSASKYLRLMVLNLKRTRDRLMNFELQKKLNHMIDSLDADSRALLIKKSDLGSQQQIKEILFNAYQGSLAAQGRKLTLRKDSSALRCFEIFSSTRNLTIEQANQNIFKFPNDSDLPDRIRMAFWRLNKDLCSITNLEKTFVLSKYGIQLNNSYVIIKEN